MKVFTLEGNGSVHPSRLDAEAQAVAAGGAHPADVFLSTDDAAYGGSGYGHRDAVFTEPVPFHGHPQSVTFDLPPLAAVVLAPAP